MRLGSHCMILLTGPTLREEPITRRRSTRGRSRSTAWEKRSPRDSPKKTMSGLTTPSWRPQRRHMGTLCASISARTSSSVYLQRQCRQVAVSKAPWHCRSLSGSIPATSSVGGLVGPRAVRWVWMGGVSWPRVPAGKGQTHTYTPTKRQRTERVDVLRVAAEELALPLQLADEEVRDRGLEVPGQQLAREAEEGDGVAAGGYNGGGGSDVVEWRDIRKGRRPRPGTARHGEGRAIQPQHRGRTHRKKSMSNMHCGSGRPYSSSCA